MEAIGFSTQDTFYVDPRVEGCDSLSSRAQRLGFRTRGFLGEGVTVCVAASTTSSAGGGGASEDAATAGAAGGAGQSRGRRLSRIHRMVTQAQTESSARPGRQAHTSIVDQARQLRAAVVSGQAFRLWLGRQESKLGGGRGERGGVPAVAGAAVAVEGKKAADRPLISRSSVGQQRAAGASRFKSREHPRVVIKDLDGLEPDRVQAFPPELLRKCFLHTDAPPGICPFTPREQWDREVLKVKKKDAQCVGAKIAARMPPAGSQKPRRGGWCECCEVQYIGTMSEHCASDRHTTAVEADPNFAALLAFESWTGAEGDSSVASDTAAGRTAAYPTPKAEVAGRDSTAVSPALPGPATKEGDHSEGGEEPLLPPAGSEAPPGCGENHSQNPVALGTGSSPSGRRQGSALSSSREGKREAPAATKEDSILEGGAISPSGLREATRGGGGSARASRGSPRLRPKPDQPSGVALRSSEPGAPGECRPAPPRVKRGTCPPDGDSRKDHRRSGSPTADTPATSVASVPSSLTDCRSNQDSSSKSSVCPAESPACDVQGPDKLPPLSASSSPTSTSSTPRTGRRRGTRGCRGESSSCVVGGALSSPPDAARRMDLRMRRGGTGGVPEAPGTSRSPPKRGGYKPNTDPQQQRLTRPSPPREIGTALSPASAMTSEQEKIDERKKKKRQKRALVLLEASAGWAASVRGAAGPCAGDRTAKSLATTSGGRSCRKVAKASPPSSGGSMAAQSQRVSKEKSPREHVGGGGGGSPSTGRTKGPSGENEKGEQPCDADRSGVAVETGSNVEARDGCGGSAATSARRCRPPLPPPPSRCPPPPAEDAHGRERLPKRARLLPRNGHDYGEEFENIPPSSDRTPPSGEKNSGGTSSSGRNRSSARQAQASSTASRMGLETAAAGQHSSPASSERTPSVSRRLGSKFAENQTSSSNAASRAPTERVAVGATSKIEPPTSKRARANATRPCTRSELPIPTRRNCLSSPGSFLTEFS